MARRALRLDWAIWAAAVVSVMAGSMVPDARVDEAVEKVDGEVHQHDDAGDDQQAPLDHRIIAAEDGIDHPFADPRPRKDSLRQDRAGEQHADLQADRRDDRYERVA